MPETFTTLTDTVLPFVKDDIDTDQIIPARFLTGTTKTGLGQKLFYDWRYDETGAVLPHSLFDTHSNKRSQILLAGHNFGCGSSREHAPWALKDFGFRAVIAVSFADIFYNNALKNFLLPIALPESAIQQLAQTIDAAPDSTVSIDLAAQHITLPQQGTLPFEISAFRKQCLLQGLDDVAYVLSYATQIQAFEAQKNS